MSAHCPNQSPEQNPAQNPDQCPAQSAPKAWHLLLCKPNQNHIALRYLAQQDLDLFMPEHLTEARWRGRMREVQRPLFAGYVFFSAAGPNVAWSKIRTTPGVAQIIGFGQNGPAAVPQGIVDGLRQRCDARGVLQPARGLGVGDRVRITSGPFAGFISDIEHIDADKRIHVLLELLGGHTKVVLAPERVTAQG